MATKQIQEIEATIKWTADRIVSGVFSVLPGPFKKITENLVGQTARKYLAEGLEKLLDLLEIDTASIDIKTAAGVEVDVHISTGKKPG